MPDSFGARLRERREQQQVALTTIAEQTKIKVSLLEALERDDVSHWPYGIFRRAFIRAYAHAIGLEPDVVLREFLDRYPDPVEIVDTLQVGAPGAEGAWVSDGPPPTRLRHLVASAIGSVSRLRARGTPRPGLLPGVSIAVEPSGSITAQHDLPERDDIPHLPVSEPVPISTDPIETSTTVVPQVFAADAPKIVAPRPDPVLLEEPPLRVHERSDPDLMAVAELRPALAHGYSDRVLAQLPRVERETNNATAAAFRAAQTCVVKSSDQVSGALAVPLMTPAGCAGVLAIELTHRREERGSVRALATIFAAQLAALIGAARPAEASGRMFA